MGDCLNSVSGLGNLVASPEYRSALGLPAEVTEVYEDLASGEYNQNFKFKHLLTGKTLVLRVERGSQLHLENQIAYEFSALKLLEGTGRTPKALYCDGSRKFCAHGVLVEEFLPGSALDYTNSRHLAQAAHIFADIHSLAGPVACGRPLTRADLGARSRTTAPAPPAFCHSERSEESQITGPVACGLITASDAFATMLDECEAMYAKYRSSSIAQAKVIKEIDRLIDEARDYVASTREGGHQSIINTEVNNTNFLITNDFGYLIDWEKPLIADPAQDIGHFLADTTTFWKTEFFFTAAQKDEFIDQYIDAIAGRFEDATLKSRCLKFASFTCLRGITWCAMASVEYATGEKDLTDPVTASKFAWYLDPARLKEVRL